MKHPAVTKHNLIIGARVRRGPDWAYADQDKGSEYGIIVNDDHRSKGWVNVHWYDKDDKCINDRNAYRIFANDLVYVPKFNIGDDVKICDRRKCNGKGWMTHSKSNFYAIDGVAGHSFRITDYHWNEKIQEFYYDYSSGYVAEHALALRYSHQNTKPRVPKYKIGDTLIMSNDRHPKARVRNNRISNPSSYIGTSVLKNDRMGVVKEIYYSEIESIHYYLFNGSGAECYREDCLDLERPSPKYKVGDVVKIINPKAKDAIFISQLNSDKESDSILSRNQTLGAITDIYYSDQNSSYYYKCLDYTNLYKENCIELKSTIINNQKSNQNGESNNTEVPRFIESESDRKGSTGVTIQSRRRKASVVSGLVSYQEIIGKRQEGSFEN